MPRKVGTLIEPDFLDHVDVLPLVPVLVVDEATGHGKAVVFPIHVLVTTIHYSVDC